MNTKQLPAIIMLAAGLVATILSIIQDINRPLQVIFVVLILFYIIGNIVKLIIDKVMAVKEKEDTEEEGQEESAEGVSEENL